VEDQARWDSSWMRRLAARDSRGGDSEEIMIWGVRGRLCCWGKEEEEEEEGWGEARSERERERRWDVVLVSVVGSLFSALSLFLSLSNRQTSQAS
jgi:hypothetical protein